MTPRAAPLPPAERRAAILRAARPLLLEQGGRFTTRQVAEAAGIAEGTLFRVFATKQDLLHAVVTDAMDATPVCRDLDAIDPALPLEQRLTAAIARMQDSVAQVSAILGALFQMPGDDMGQLPKAPRHADPDARGHHDEQVALLQRSVAAVLGPDADRLSCSTDQAAALVRSVAFATTHPHLRDDTLTDPAQLAALLLHGMLGRTPATRGGQPC